MNDKKLYWYIVYWSNKNFLGTKSNPQKPGTIFGVKDKYEEDHRIGFDDKSKNFVIVEKFLLLHHSNPKNFKKWLESIEG